MEIVVKKPSEDEVKETESWGVWEKEVSEFPWEYDEQETCYILEGKAKVKSDTQEVEFGKGDLVIFPKGIKCTWTIIEKIKKHYKFG